MEQSCYSHGRPLVSPLDRYGSPPPPKTRAAGASVILVQRSAPHPDAPSSTGTQRRRRHDRRRRRPRRRPRPDTPDATAQGVTVRCSARVCGVTHLLCSRPRWPGAVLLADAALRGYLRSVTRPPHSLGQYFLADPPHSLGPHFLATADLFGTAAHIPCGLQRCGRRVCPTRILQCVGCPNLCSTTTPLSRYSCKQTAVGVCCCWATRRYVVRGGPT